MDKISFIIPNKKNQNLQIQKDIIDNKNENNIKQTNYTNNLIDYINIAPNVFKFGNINFNIEDDIYALYNKACLVKQENKYKAIEMFKKCYKLINKNTKLEIKYEIYINLGLLLSETDGNKDEIINYYEEALIISPDRAEPYFYCSIYCNKIHNYEKSYEFLKKALLLSYDEVNLKYPGTQFTSYGKYLYDELSVACFWLEKYEESKILLEQIIDDPDFSESRERIKANLEITKSKII
jgi:tetratricopeptide (TPR) repeat protein